MGRSGYAGVSFLTDRRFCRMRQSELLAVRRAAMALGYQVDEKRIAGCSKSATKDMSRFQQPASNYANFAEVNVV